LQTVVANCAGGRQRLVDIALSLSGAIGAIGPYAGKAIGLQFDPHRQTIRIAFRQFAAVPAPTGVPAGSAWCHDLRDPLPRNRPALKRSRSSLRRSMYTF
jgi:hypothetical protein